MGYVTFKGKKYEAKDGTLDLNFNKITHIKEIKGLENLTDLRELYLNRCSINEIKGLDSLINLRVLDLHDNSHIDEIKGLENLSKLEELYLHDNLFIKEIKGLDTLTNLRVLDLHRNHSIKEIKGLDTLTNLRVLDLHRIHYIKEIKGLNNLINLRKLNLNQNKIKEIKGLEKLIKLQELNLSWNEIIKIERLENLTNLQSLNLNRNNIRAIKGLESLINLQELDISFNKIKVIKGLDHFTELKKIDLSGNPIPKEMMKQLQHELKRKGCTLVKTVLRKAERFYPTRTQEVIYEVVDNKLDLSRADIEDMSEVQGLDELYDLKELDLSKNHFTEIKGLENLTSLEILKINDTYAPPDPWADAWERDAMRNYPKIRIISGIDKLVKLKELYLRDNRIREIRGLENLKKLEKLDLSRNEITTIKGLENLKNLKELNISDNKVPRELINELGGSNNKDLAKDPMKFVEYSHLLKNFTESESTTTKIVIINEIKEEFAAGHNSIMINLLNQGYLNDLNEKDLKILIQGIEAPLKIYLKTTPEIFNVALLVIAKKRNISIGDLKNELEIEFEKEFETKTGKYAEWRGKKTKGYLEWKVNKYKKFI